MQQGIFSISITFLTLQIVTVLKHANSLQWHLLMHIKYHTVIFYKTRNTFETSKQNVLKLWHTRAKIAEITLGLFAIFFVS